MDIGYIITVLSFFLAGYGWNAFWKTIDYSLREWVKNTKYGLIVEAIIDLLHHTKAYLLLIFYAVNFLYPLEPMAAIALISFALGNIFLDAPKEKERILSILLALLATRAKEEEVVKEIEERAKELAEQLVEKFAGEEEEEEEVEEEEGEKEEGVIE